MNVVIGPFPPPVHGMSKNLIAFADDVDALGGTQVVRLNISPGGLDRGFMYHLIKARRVLFSACRLLYILSLGKASNIYIPPDGGVGIWYTNIFVFLVTIFRKPIYFHHRSFAYIDKPSLGMKLLVKMQRDSISNHVFLCSCMMNKFISVYAGKYVSSVLSNSSHVRNVNINGTVPTFDGHFKLGFLSNISFSKGLRQCVELAVMMHERGVVVNLNIAGLYESNREKIYLESYIERYDFIHYFGPVYGDEKNVFYSRNNFFLFPSTYKNEAQPNVIFEAMAYGLPVLTCDVGCIKGDVARFGYVHASEVDFIDGAFEYLCRYLDGTESYSAMVANILTNIESKANEAWLEYEKFLTRFSNE